MSRTSFLPTRETLSKTIVVYDDAGVASGAFQQLLLALQHPSLAVYSLESVNRRFFLTPQWEKGTALVVFPGGRDLPYLDALQGEANRRITTFVEGGGRFLGICAGAYYASQSIVFAQGSELEIVGRRELAFFPGRAIGPAYSAPFCYEGEEGARVASIVWEGGISSLYFNGGCLFENAENYPSIQVIARYHDLPHKPAAAVYCPRGRGAALLSGVHPEYAPFDPFWFYIINKILI
jgi:biotin---protein ligase